MESGCFIYLIYLLLLYTVYIEILVLLHTTPLHTILNLNFRMEFCVNCAWDVNVLVLVLDIDLH